MAHGHIFLPWAPGVLQCQPSALLEHPPQHQPRSSYRSPTTSLRPSLPLMLTVPPIREVPLSVISQLQYLLSDLVASCIPCLFCFLTPEGAPCPPVSGSTSPASPSLWLHPTPATLRSRRISPSPTLSHTVFSICSLPARLGLFFPSFWSSVHLSVQPFFSNPGSHHLQNSSPWKNL